MVDRCRQVLEEPLQGSRVVGVEGRGALRAKFQRRLLEQVDACAPPITTTVCRPLGT
jgi:hypothetical protein